MASRKGLTEIVRQDSPCPVWPAVTKALKWAPVLKRAYAQGLHLQDFIRTYSWFFKSCAAIAVLAALFAQTLHPQLSQLDKIQQQGTLTIITRNSPTTYFQDKDQTSGFEYELAQTFANMLGVTLEVKVANTLDELLVALEKGEAQIAAAGLTINEARQQRVRFGDVYMDVKQLLVYRSGKKAPDSLADVKNSRLVVMGDSSHSQHLQNIQRNLMPDLSWIESTDVEVVELVQMVENNEIDYTIINSNEFEAFASFFPHVRVAFELNDGLQMAWAFGRQSDNSLFDAARDFFYDMRESGELSQLQERYYGHLEQLDPAGTLTFLRKTDDRLDELQQLFSMAETETGIDWRLLAAISYQESHWKPLARSRTGVRGLMMLTRRTASEVGVENRLDPEQSVMGGARYFAQLKRQYSYITEPDQTWFALAAYNVGAGHVSDAQELTRQRGQDPSRWMDVKNQLPLLSKKKWHSQTKHGYARGWEPVQYVQNIRRFYDLLVWREQRQQQLANGSADKSLLLAADTNFRRVAPLNEDWQVDF